MSPKKRARSVKDKEMQFKRILKAGEGLLQEKKGAFSMRELARRLDMAPSNLYNYVKNENELRVAILHAHFTMNGEDLERLTEMRGKTYLEMLEALITHFFEANNGWAAIELMSLQGSTEDHPIDLGLMIDPYRHFIEKAVNAGELPGQDIELSALYVWSLLQGTANTLRLAESSMMFDEVRQEVYTKYVKNLIIASLKTMPTIP